MTKREPQQKDQVITDKAPDTDLGRSEPQDDNGFEGFDLADLGILDLENNGKESILQFNSTIDAAAFLGKNVLTPQGVHVLHSVNKDGYLEAPEHFKYPMGVVTPYYGQEAAAQ